MQKRKPGTPHKGWKDSARKAKETTMLATKEEVAKIDFIACWQNIETAPLDGTPVILFCPGMNSWNRKGGMPDIVVGLWETHGPISRGGGPWETGSWFSDIGDVDQGYESTGAYFEHEVLRPSHWMPLPTPPKSP